MTAYDGHIFLCEWPVDGFLAGWYFGTETEDLEGPFSTMEEAQDARDKYFTTLD